MSEQGLMCSTVKNESFFVWPGKTRLPNTEQKPYLDDEHWIGFHFKYSSGRTIRFIFQSKFQICKWFWLSTGVKPHCSLEAGHLLHVYCILPNIWFRLANSSITCAIKSTNAPCCFVRDLISGYWCRLDSSFPCPFCMLNFSFFRFFKAWQSCLILWWPLIACAAQFWKQ